MESALGCPVTLPSVDTFTELAVLALESEIVVIVGLVIVLL